MARYQVGKSLLSQLDQSIFWHNMWLECGWPTNWVIADLMRRTRVSYHYAIRKIRCDKQDIVNQLLENHSQDLWMEVKRIRNKVCPAAYKKALVHLLISLVFLLINIRTYIAFNLI